MIAFITGYFLGEIGYFISNLLNFKIVSLFRLVFYFSSIVYIVTPQITVNMALKLLFNKHNTTILAHGLPMSHVTPKVRSLRGDPWGIACATLSFNYFSDL